MTSRPFPLCSGRGCTRESVITWEAGAARNSTRQWAAAGSCADPRHAAFVQAWVAKQGGGPVRVVAGDLDRVLPDPDAAWSLFDEGIA